MTIAQVEKMQHTLKGYGCLQEEHARLQGEYAQLQRKYVRLQVKNSLLFREDT
jgi:hypothetical protein